MSFEGEGVIKEDIISDLGLTTPESLIAFTLR